MSSGVIYDPVIDLNEVIRVTVIYVLSISEEKERICKVIRDLIVNEVTGMLKVITVTRKVGHGLACLGEVVLADAVDLKVNELALEILNVSFAVVTADEHLSCRLDSIDERADSGRCLGFLKNTVNVKLNGIILNNDLKVRLLSVINVKRGEYDILYRAGFVLNFLFT